MIPTQYEIDIPTQYEIDLHNSATAIKNCAEITMNVANLILDAILTKPAKFSTLPLKNIKIQSDIIIQSEIILKNSHETLKSEIKKIKILQKNKADDVLMEFKELNNQRLTQLPKIRGKNLCKLNGADGVS